MALLSLYVVASFIQALLCARGINKMEPISHPKTVVALFTLLGPIVTVVFLLGVLAGAVERAVKG